MIEWASPLAFGLLPLALALPLQAWLTGRNRLAVPDGARLEGAWSLRLLLSPLPGLLRVVGLLLLVLALARPRITHRDVVIESDGLDILLVVDTSGSMQAEDFRVGVSPVNRLQVAKGVMSEFIAQRPYDRIGVVVFGEEAFTHVPLTLDHDTLQDVLQHVEIGLAGGSGTAIGTALAVASRRMLQIEAPSRVVILLTDGRSNVGEPEPLTAADLAAAVGIRVYTIGVGGAGGGMFGDDGIDEPLMRAIADKTGGRFFRATSTQALREVYATIDELETSPAEVRELVEHEELFRWFLVPGFAMLLLEALLSHTFLRRGP